MADQAPRTVRFAEPPEAPTRTSQRPPDPPQPVLAGQPPVPVPLPQQQAGPEVLPLRFQNANAPPPRAVSANVPGSLQAQGPPGVNVAPRFGSAPAGTNRAVPGAAVPGTSLSRLEQVAPAAPTARIPGTALPGTRVPAVLPVAAGQVPALRVSPTATASRLPGTAVPNLRVPGTLQSQQQVEDEFADLPALSPAQSPAARFPAGIAATARTGGATLPGTTIPTVDTTGLFGSTVQRFPPAGPSVTAAPIALPLEPTNIAVGTGAIQAQRFPLPPATFGTLGTRTSAAPPAPLSFGGIGGDLPDQVMTTGTARFPPNRGTFAPPPPSTSAAGDVIGSEAPQTLPVAAPVEAAARFPNIDVAQRRPVSSNVTDTTTTTTLPAPPGVSPNAVTTSTFVPGAANATAPTVPPTSPAAAPVAAVVPPSTTTATVSTGTSPLVPVVPVVPAATTAATTTTTTTATSPTVPTTTTATTPAAATTTTTGTTTTQPLVSALRTTQRVSPVRPASPVAAAQAARNAVGRVVGNVPRFVQRPVRTPPPPPGYRNAFGQPVVAPQQPGIFSRLFSGAPSRPTGYPPQYPPNALLKQPPYYYPPPPPPPPPPQAAQQPIPPPPPPPAPVAAVKQAAQVPALAAVAPAVVAAAVPAAPAVAAAAAPAPAPAPPAAAAAAAPASPATEIPLLERLFGRLGRSTPTQQGEQPGAPALQRLEQQRQNQERAALGLPPVPQAGQVNAPVAAAGGGAIPPAAGAPVSGVQRQSVPPLPQQLALQQQQQLLQQQQQLPYLVPGAGAGFFEPGRPVGLAAGQPVPLQGRVDIAGNAAARQADAARRINNISVASEQVAGLEGIAGSSGGVAAAGQFALQPQEQQAAGYGEQIAGTTTYTNATPSRTIVNVLKITPTPTQYIPPQHYRLDILGVPYTVIRFIGYKESPWLLSAIEQHALNNPGDWTGIPLSLSDIPTCPGVAKPPDTSDLLDAIAWVDALQGQLLQGNIATDQICAAVTRERYYRYTDAIFAAMAYRLNAFGCLDQSQLICFLRVAAYYGLCIDVKMAAHRLLSLTREQSLANYALFLATMAEFAPFLTNPQNPKALSEARFWRTVRAATVKALPIHGFSQLAYVMLLSGSPEWTGRLMSVLGEAVASTKGLGTQAVTGALVEALVNPGDPSTTDEQALVDKIQIVSAYLSDLRVQQEGDVVDTGVAERLFMWVRTVEPIDIEVVKEQQIQPGSCNSEAVTCHRYTALVLTSSPDPSNPEKCIMHYSNHRTLRGVDECGRPVCQTVLEQVSGIQTFLDGWTSLIIRPKSVAQATALSAHFAPNTGFQRLLLPVPGDTACAFRIERERLVQALLNDPTLCQQFRSAGILQGFPISR